MTKTQVINRRNNLDTQRTSLLGQLETYNGKIEDLGTKEGQREILSC